MEAYIQLIFILALFKYALKAALTSRFWIILCYGLVASTIGFLLYPVVIEQPVTIISSILNDQKWVTDTAVVTTLEAVTGIFISVYLLDNYFAPKQNRKKFVFVLKVLPGILFCLAIAYFELLFFKWRVGADFQITAMIYFLLVFVVTVSLSFLLRYLLKGESVKLELKLILNIGVLIIGLLVNASVADYNLSNAEAVIEWKALLSLIGLTILFFILGFYFSKLNIKSLFKHK